jgi:hypothetical protein
MEVERESVPRFVSESLAANSEMLRELEEQITSNEKLSMQSQERLFGGTTSQPKASSSPFDSIQIPSLSSDFDSNLLSNSYLLPTVTSSSNRRNEVSIPNIVSMPVLANLKSKPPPQSSSQPSIRSNSKNRDGFSNNGNRTTPKELQIPMVISRNPTRAMNDAALSGIDELLSSSAKPSSSSKPSRNSKKKVDEDAMDIDEPS